MKMKTKITSICALALLITACSNDNDPINGGQDGAEKNEIKLGTSVMTRASVESEGAGILIVGQDPIDIAFLRAPDSVNTVDMSKIWVDAITGSQAVSGVTTGVVTATLSRAADGQSNILAFDAPQYYNIDADKYSHLKGFYPVVALTKSDTVQAVWTIDGAMDVMASDYFQHNKGATSNTVAVRFQHLLSKITVNILADSQGSIDSWGTVDKVEIKEVPSQVRHKFNGKTADQYALDSLANTKADITIKNVAAGQTQDTDASTTTLEVDATAKGKTFGQAMVYPDKDYNLMITTSKGGVYGPVTATIDGGAKPGMNHVITLTFKAGEITASTTVKPWEDGGTGTGTIQ